MAIRYVSVVPDLAFTIYYTSLSVEQTDERMQTHAHAHTQTRVDITGHVRLIVFGSINS